MIFLEIDDGYHLKERASKKFSVGKVCNDEGSCQLGKKKWIQVVNQLLPSYPATFYQTRGLTLDALELSELLPDYTKDNLNYCLLDRQTL